VPIVSDNWAGLDAFFVPGEEILLADRADDVLAALNMSDAELRRIADAARARVLAEHSSAARARELVALLEHATASVPVTA
jgi:spore maturation protein CgeB